MKPIVVVGSVNTDMTVKMARIPAPGETVIGGTFLMAQGGKGANQAVAAARAGASVAFVGRVGRDIFGEQARESLRQDGVRVDHLATDPAASTGIALIFVDETGENSIAVASGANAGVTVADVEGARDVIAAAGVLLMQLEIPLPAVAAAARIAAAHGVPVILNPAPAQPLDADLLRQIAMLTPNETEAERLTGIAVTDEGTAAEAARALRGLGVRRVFLTLGAKGVYVQDEAGSLMVPAFSVEAVDTTGAGDVFNGALAAALTEGMTVYDAVRFANAAAAISVTRRGAQPSAPRRTEIDALVRESYVGVIQESGER
ncbi:MAG: ribokinase [Acidobacteria bacterium]|nr:ribokinase [Acidobacteriota bacterium]